jgi:Rrf2 family iron-sulfur cluster assembly transcriptional regulator
MFSGTAVYALRAVVYLAEHSRERPVRVSEMASDLDVPRNYLAKILNELVRSRVLASTRGKNGGFQLAVEPQELSLFMVVTPFDRIEEERRCLLGRPECSDRTPCAAHHRWKELGSQLAAFVRETTVADLLTN